jgi:hypothetical protein
MLVLAKMSGETKENSAAFLSSHPAGMERVVSWEKVREEINSNKSKIPYRAEVSK